MKKRVALCMAGILFMMGISAQASGGFNSVANGAGRIISVSSERGTAELSDKFDDAATQEEVDRINSMLDKSVAEALGLNTLKLFDFAESKYIRDEDIRQYKFLTRVENLTITADPVPSEENPIILKFIANNITSNMEICVLHKCENHSWELYETQVTGNEVAANFHSLSPVALVYKEKSVTQTDGTGTSPKTGEGNTEIFGLFAAIMLGGLGTVMFKRSRRIS